ncbi:MAG: CpsB/CapC family capsule biosynthesis tyrosine phosphatase [Candidatus Aquicultor sp.]|nr:CpsB/CapC family capsule biosynthesis tyrosine phosphatase [Candidatus Aquicultor sp.]
MAGFVDIHNHILPGLDDGAETLEEAVEMARLAHQNGITRIVATPHQNDWHHVTGQETLAGVELLQAVLRERGVPVDIYAGSELRMSPDIPERLASQTALPLAGSSYVLIEFYFDTIPFFSEEVVFRLRTAGWKPIIAHPERVYDIQRKPERLERFIDMGCLTHINVSSLTGELGRSCLDTAVALLKRGWVDIIASDSHGAENRPPDFGAALSVAAKIVGEEAARALVLENPARIFEEEQ